MLTIKQLSHSLGHQSLFDGLDLTVEAGQNIVIVGDSGSGKSTLLKVIMGNKSPAIEFSENSTATMVLQQGALLDHLDVIGNLQLVQRFTGMRDADKITQLLQQLNIDESLHHARISQLSGGQLRRVAIARALLTDPEIVLFDEPGAGLDIANLQSLAELVNQLTADKQKATVTVSHNPYYIARIATQVYRLQNGQLELLADWVEPSENESEVEQRQQQLQAILSEKSHKESVDQAKPIKVSKKWIVVDWLKYAGLSLLSLFHWPKSWGDTIKVGGYSVYLGLLSGLLFFALVGAMLGTTTIAVVKMLSDNTLTGIIGMFVKPEMLLNMMGGVYVLYLAPAIGGMLFVARSGSIMCNWLGEMVRGQQVAALKYLGVPSKQYLSAPAVLGVYISCVGMIVWFAICTWFGSVYAAEYLFNAADPFNVMRVNDYDIRISLFWPKLLLYGAIVSLTVVGLGMAAKRTAHQVNLYTTKSIIYSTLSIAAVELIIVLTKY